MKIVLFKDIDSEQPKAHQPMSNKKNEYEVADGLNNKLILLELKLDDFENRYCSDN